MDFMTTVPAPMKLFLAILIFSIITELQPTNMLFDNLLLQQMQEEGAK